MLPADPIATVHQRAPARHRRRRGVRLPSRAAARSQRWRTRRRGRGGRCRASRTRGPTTGGLAAVRACQITSTVRDGRETLYGVAEKTVEDQRRSIAIVAKTVAEPLDGARRTWTTLEYWPSLRPVKDDPGRVAHSYGSEGWGLSPHSAKRPSDAEPNCARFRDVKGRCIPRPRRPRSSAGASPLRRRNQSCQDLGLTTPGNSANSPGSPFNEPTSGGNPNNPGGIGGQNYSPTSQYDVACFQQSQHH